MLLHCLAATCELLSVFLLSVEAIKLENLKNFRTKVLRPLLAYLDPTITFFEGAGSREDRMVNAPVWTRIFFMVVFGSPFLILGIWWIYTLRYEYPAFFVDRTFGFPPLILYTLAVICTLVSFYICMVIGAFVYSAIVFILERVISILKVIEDKTATGIIGILGFSLYAVSFSIHHLF